MWGFGPTCISQVRNAIETCPPDVWFDVQSVDAAAQAVAPSSWLGTAAMSEYQKEAHAEFCEALTRTNPDFAGSDDQLFSQEPLGGCAYAGRSFGCLAASIALPLHSGQACGQHRPRSGSSQCRRLGASAVDALFQMVDSIRHIDRAMSSSA